MTPFALVAGMLKPMLWLLPIVLLLAFLKSRMFKGWFGEKLVSRKARLRLSSSDYSAYDNVTIPDGNGTTQIDHIYVSRFGVFVVETKNMNGWIFGRDNQAQWTQTIYRNTFKFQNPIRQNFKHVKTLETLLQLPASKLHSVIVFTGDSTFKNELPPCICTLSNFTAYIESFTSPVLSDSEIADVRRRIETGRLVASHATHAAHVRHLRNKHHQ